MSKTIVKEDIRVVVTPFIWGKWDEAYALKKADEIRGAIKRHIDDIDSVYVEYKTSERCSFCNRDWEIYEGLPFCCTEAVEEYSREHPNLLQP